MVVKLLVQREIEVEVDDKWEKLDCPLNEYVKRLDNGEIADEDIEDCMQEIEKLVGIPFYDTAPSVHPYDEIVCVEGKHTMIEF